jgi:hypothetical protein
MTAAGFPTLFGLIAFSSVYNDTTPDWVDVIGYAQSLSGQRGRQDELSICEPGTYSMVLRNTDDRFNPDNASGPYYGQLRPNKRFRVGATVLGTDYPIFTGWTESFVLSPDQATCTVTAVDRFGLLSRQKDTFNSRPDEYADVRITALLQHFGIGSGTGTSTPTPSPHGRWRRTTTTTCSCSTRSTTPRSGTAGCCSWTSGGWSSTRPSGSVSLVVVGRR